MHTFRNKLQKLLSFVVLAVGSSEIKVKKRCFQLNFIYSRNSTYCIIGPKGELRISLQQLGFLVVNKSNWGRCCTFSELAWKVSFDRYPCHKDKWVMLEVWCLHEGNYQCLQSILFCHKEKHQADVLLSFIYTVDFTSVEWTLAPVVSLLSMANHWVGIQKCFCPICEKDLLDSP